MQESLLVWHCNEMPKPLRENALIQKALQKAIEAIEKGW